MAKAPPWANFIPHDPSKESEREQKPKAPPWANFIPGPSETPQEPQREPERAPQPLTVVVGGETPETDAQDVTEPETDEDEGTPVGVCKYCGKDFRHKRDPERSVTGHIRAVHNT